MKNLQIKNIVISLLAALIVLVTFAKTKIQLKNNSDFSSRLYSFKQPDTNFLSFGACNAGEDLPQTPPQIPKSTPFENKSEKNDTNPGADDDYNNRFCSLFHSLIVSESALKFSYENTGSHRTVFLPFYILFHSWKSFLS